MIVPGPNRFNQLRALLESPRVECLMEAHNGISARIVEEAGFKGIWASGLAISAQFGVRDNNEASDGERQHRADIGEFCGKIKAGKDSQSEPDFCIVACGEALIAGWGLGGALDALRARADVGRLNMRDLLDHLVAQGRPVKVLYIHGHWLDVNSLEDVNPAHDFTHGHWN